jgi:hypothetical protein
MKIVIVMGVMAASVLLGGCGKKNGLSVSSTSPAKAQTETDASSPATFTQTQAHVAASPVTQPVLTAWQEGDKSAAISRFLNADWSARPIFAAGMVLSLNEAQFKALPDADRQLKSDEMMAQLDLMKQLAAAVAQAGRDAVAQSAAAQARKCFTSLKQFGTALDSADRLQLVQIVGRVSKKMADNELAKMGQ